MRKTVLQDRKEGVAYLADAYSLPTN